MAFKFKMPDVGEGMAEGEIVKWLVAEGDTVEEEDSVAEIQNDKSVEEIATPVSGTIKKILVPEGTVATVGDVLIEIDAPGHEDVNEEDAAPSTPSSPANEEKATDPAASGSNGSSIYKFLMPDVGEGMAEGEIVKWLIAEGDTIEEEDSIAEIQNDKSVEEIASPVSGTVKSILVSEGTVASVGDVLVEIDAPGYVDSSAPAAETTSAATSTTEREPAAATPQTGERNERVLAMPSVRQFARDNDVEIALVTPSGKGGRTTKEDVQSFMSGETTAPAKETEKAAATPAKETESKKEAAPAAQPFSSSMEESETREKMTGMRKAIAKAMVNSKQTAPHVTLHDEVEVSKLWDHRKKFKTVAAEKGTKLTFLPYVVKALSATVKAYPVMNASIDDATQEIVYKNYINIGIATDTDNGLYVPNVKNADAKGMFTIADEINAKAAQAHEGKLAAADMRNGSISISNIGSVGGGWFTPVINYPEVAILGVGTIAQQPVVNADGEIAVGRMMKLSLSFDHRIVDGATAQKAMNNIKRLLADPELLLMEG
ncbi:dihydrolipoyllysine-residue acetyltransferase [Desemzia sp. RIT804]|uniref:dihydrolipoyllysine-residue acetyltransferase n=1 Tax=Desemzia sp. RIT 804 TaxID=2810209 RepID=UPI001951D77B|nr:dihydrolipoyllysine-residue acetyltransferase [Desemzia sp. RIT 804]MBM6613609.1 dihydrolipoyllysine-residue acetyltransferase [Desemzia sp. RIT 804]